MRAISDKAIQHVPRDPRAASETLPGAETVRRAACMSDAELQRLRDIARRVERHYGARRTSNGRSSVEAAQILLLQSRPGDGLVGAGRPRRWRAPPDNPPVACDVDLRRPFDDADVQGGARDHAAARRIRLRRAAPGARRHEDQPQARRDRLARPLSPAAAPTALAPLQPPEASPRGAPGAIRACTRSRRRCWVPSIARRSPARAPFVRGRLSGG